MRGEIILFWLLLVASAAMSAYWWQEANAPMTAETLARLCGDRSECYPEIGYILGAMPMGCVALATALTLVIEGLRARRMRHAKTVSEQ
jgi:hypothetical protein